MKNIVVNIRLWVNGDAHIGMGFEAGRQILHGLHFTFDQFCRSEYQAGEEAGEETSDCRIERRVPVGGEFLGQVLAIAVRREENRLLRGLRYDGGQSTREESSPTVFPVQVAEDLVQLALQFWMCLHVHLDGVQGQTDEITDGRPVQAGHEIDRSCRLGTCTSKPR